MWSDNEAAHDQLGFDVFADGIVEALTIESLYPLTIGVFGDWGSGKSSLLKIAREQVESELGDKFRTVQFSPWAHEDYDDVKVALMSAILDAVASSPDVELPQVDRLRRFLGKLRRARRPVVTAGTVLGPGLVGLAAGDLSAGFLSPEIAEMVGTAAGAGTKAAIPSSEPGGPESVVEIESLGDFRDEFQKLIRLDPSIEAVVVFVDDLDRCLPETVVDTFEAIRLFLDTPKCAFIVAANRMIVEESVNMRYRDFAAGESTIGHDYLEKMVQLQVALPVMTDPETKAFVNLLLCQLHLEPSAYEGVLTGYRTRRSNDPFSGELDAVLVAELLQGDLPDGLAADLAWSDEVVASLAAGLRGNPRQVKRFLNDLRLRLGAARRGKVALDPAVLAKLMVLEELDLSGLQVLVDWQRSAEGPIPNLRLAEALVRTDVTSPKPKPKKATGASKSAGAKDSNSAGGDETITEVEPKTPAEVASWIEMSGVRRWLEIGIPIGEQDLRRYFTFFRSKIQFSAAASRLTPAARAVYVKLISDATATMRSGATDGQTLGEADLMSLTSALRADMLLDPSTHALMRASELAARAPAAAGEIIDAILSVPHRRIPKLAPVKILNRLKGVSGVDVITQAWSASEEPHLRQAVEMLGR